MRKHFIDNLCAMLGAGEPADPCKAERYRWLHETAAAWLDASRRCHAVWIELVRNIPDDQIDEVEIPDPPEQAEEDALWQQLDDVIQEDKWPKHLYFGCL
ncbi:MAG TPA: hypothetical protein VFW35_04855 [Sphingomicrobium sp.]|nr:hypothetical protein [Sphingomicrobium sp.]